MMTMIFVFIIVFSVVISIFTGRTEMVGTAAIESAGAAVELCVSLLGSMCLWSGVMKVADRAGLSGKLSNLLSPVVRLLFPKLDPKGDAAKAISANISANLLGLGNAATPFGITAMRELEKTNREKSQASHYMIMFVVLNTASMQLLPTTVAALRSQTGASDPLDILPCVLITSFCSVLSGVLMVTLCGRIWDRGFEKNRKIFRGNGSIQLVDGRSEKQRH